MERHSVNFLSENHINNLTCVISQDNEIYTRDELLNTIESMNTEEYQKINPLEVGKKKEKIGSGSYGNVYLTSHDYAIKLQNSTEGYTPDMLWEGSLLTYFDHPYIIKPLGIFTNPNDIRKIKNISYNYRSSMGIVMPKMKMNLREYILSEKYNDNKLPVEIIQTYALQIAQAMLYYMNQNIYHGDLKPLNILIDEDNNTKIIDFGSGSTYCHRQDIPRSKYFTSLWYRAPEIIFNNPLINEKVDIWSYGCILYEMFTGNPLFPADSDDDLKYKMFHLLGIPSMEEWPSVHKLRSFKAFINNRFPTFDKNRLIEKLENEDFPDDMIDLLSQIFVFDPYKRIDIEYIISHPFFAGNPLLDNFCTSRLNCVDSLRFREVILTNTYENNWFNDTMDIYVELFETYNISYTHKYIILSHALTLIYILGEDREKVIIKSHLIKSILLIVSTLNNIDFDIDEIDMDSDLIGPIRAVINKLNWHILPTTIYDYYLAMKPDNLSGINDDKVTRKIMSYYKDYMKMRESPFFLAQEALASI